MDEQEMPTGELRFPIADLMTMPHPYSVSDARMIGGKYWVCVILRDGVPHATGIGCVDREEAEMQAGIVCGALAIAHVLTQKLHENPDWMAFLERKKAEMSSEELERLRAAATAAGLRIDRKDVH